MLSPFTNQLVFISSLYGLNALVFLPSFTVLCTMGIITSQCERCWLEHNRLMPVKVCSMNALFASQMVTFCWTHYPKLFQALLTVFPPESLCFEMDRMFCLSSYRCWIQLIHERCPPASQVLKAPYTSENSLPVS